ncbi:MAG: glycosyltransferase family 4 protein [Anaerolineales bacterium]|nr:glycosyltransferase family 4 protein [Anaerolineales bacterium]
MKILYFSFDYTAHDHRFLAALAETGHELVYARLQRGNRQTEDRPVPARVEQVQWVGGQGPFAWRDLPRLAGSLCAVIRRTQPDLIHAGPIQTCGLLATLTGFRPRLIMSWGFDLMEDCDRNAWMRWATHYVLRRATFFTSDSQATRDRAVAFGMRPERTVVFPWGVDLGHFSAPTRKRSDTKTFTLFCNRAWEPRYGVAVLAQAFVQVAHLRPDVNLLLLGGGSQAASLRQIFEGGGVAGQVTCVGQISQADLPRYYAMADLYISPSHVDGSSVSLMEALACGLPCLVSDIPANREWVVEGVNGWLFPDGNAGALAAKILRVIEERPSLAQIGMAARRTAEEKADWSKNFSLLLDAYEQTVRFHA